jgi:hypothetical protein
MAWFGALCGCYVQAKVRCLVRCGGGCKANKQGKGAGLYKPSKISKGLVLGVGAVRVRCQAKVKCLVSVLVYLSKQRLGAGAKQWCGLISKQGLGAGLRC